MSKGTGICIDCASATGTANRRCEVCRLAHWHYMDYLRGASEARREVVLAIREGRLAPATSLLCVDCGRPAVEYDHRDYGRPLDVEPVCRRDNLRRGLAVPKRLAPDEVIARLATLNRHRTRFDRGEIAVRLSRWPALSRYLPGVDPSRLSALRQESAA